VGWEGSAYICYLKIHKCKVGWIVHIFSSKTHKVGVWNFLMVKANKIHKSMLLFIFSYQKYAPTPH